MYCMANPSHHLAFKLVAPPPGPQRTILPEPPLLSDIDKTSAAQLHFLNNDKTGSKL